MRETLHDYCVRTGGLDLLQQWHPTKNGNLTAKTLSYGSRQKVWWRCAAGHEWQTAVYIRTSGQAGCPYCAGLRVQMGDNDLAARRPDLAAQWHPDKNSPLTPRDVTEGSHKSVWWVCEKGHEWRAMVKTRVAGAGCPVCAGRKVVPGENDLATTHPTVASQWHPTKNGGLTPRQVTAGTERKVWWQCEKGHEWQAAVFSRAGGKGCPVCTGKTIVPGENDLATLFPAVAAQWHPAKNAPLTPQNVSPYSNKKVWWRCGKGHAWKATVNSRTGFGAGCPVCANRQVLAGFNDLATTEPAIAAQWHPTLNGSLTPQMVTAGSSRRVWWQCPEGHVWRAIVYSRAGPGKCGCPVCAGRVSEARQRRYAAMQTAQE